MKTNAIILNKTVIRVGLLWFLLILVMMACRKDIEVSKSGPLPGDLKSMKDMKVPNEFSWKTFQEIEFELTASTMGVVIIQSMEGVVFEKALLMPHVPYQALLAVPTYETELSLVYNGIPHSIKITERKISYSF